MSYTFSGDLIMRYLKYMEDTYSVIFSEDEAQQHLDSLGSLYLNFTIWDDTDDVSQV